jgi:hypothetical protein
MPGISSLDALQRGANEFDITQFQLDIEPTALAAARKSLGESGLLLLGEVHGVRQNPLVARALMAELDITGLAMEWPAGLASVVSGFFSDGRVPEHPQLWAGDGRITAGHFALLWERFKAGRLAALTLFDGVNEVGWSRREAAMADRILSAQAPGVRTLVIAGNAHTALGPTGLGIPLGARLAERRPGVREVRIRYGNGGYYNLSPQRFKYHWTVRRHARLRLENGNLILDLPSPVQARVPHRMQSSEELRHPAPPGFTGSFPALREEAERHGAWPTGEADPFGYPVPQGRPLPRPARPSAGQPYPDPPAQPPRPGSSPEHGSSPRHGRPSPYGQPEQYGQAQQYGQPEQNPQQPRYGQSPQYGHPPEFDQSGQLDQTGRPGRPLRHGQPERGTGQQPRYSGPPSAPFRTGQGNQGQGDAPQPDPRRGRRLPYEVELPTG